MQDEQKPYKNTDEMLSALRKHLQEVKTWPQDKQDEYWDTMDNKYAYMTRKRAVEWAGTDEQLVEYVDHPSGDMAKGEMDYPETRSTVEQAKAAIASTIYMLERESAYDFKEHLNGLIYLEGLEPEWLRVTEFETPQPADKVAIYFPDSNE